MTHPTQLWLASQRVLAGLCACSLIPLLSGAPSPSAADVPLHRLGTNLAEVRDGTSARPFLNLFKQSRSWITQCVGDPDCGWTWDTGESEQLDLDANGWIRSLPAASAPGYSAAATLISLPEDTPGGRYVMRYDGTGSIDYRFAAQRVDAESGARRDVLEVDPTAGMMLIRIRATDPAGTGDYLRNLRLVQEEHEALLDTEVFHPNFINRTAPFRVLRFADWLKAGGEASGRWTERPLVDDARYTGADGVPAEQLIALANRVQSAPWISLPYRADDEYVLGLAELVRDQLAPDLPVYLEYSTAAWGTGGARYHYMAERARETWPGNGASEFIQVMNWYGKRSVEVCDLWRGAFGDDAGRVHCVMSSQAENAGVGVAALECPLWVEGAPCSAHGIDALAIAPLFGYYLGDPANTATLEAWIAQADGGLDALFAELELGGTVPEGPSLGALAQAQDWIDDHASLAAAQGVSLLAYASGQKLAGHSGTEWNDDIVGLFHAANEDARMGALYLDYLTGWETASDAVILHGAHIAEASRQGSPGALTDATETTSPKYGALLAHAGSSAAGTPRLGTNLADVNDWSTQLPFTDLFKISRDWLTQCALYVETPDPGCTGQWDTGEADLLDLDEHGWVRSLPAPEDAPIFTRATTYWALSEHFPLGRYVVTYDGSGELLYGLGASKIDAESTTGRDVIEIGATSGMTLTIATTDPDNYIRNIRVLPEAIALAEEAGTPAPLFNPSFIERTAPYQVLRFMDWLHTNTADLTDWTDRPRMEDARWTEQGVPIEAMLALSAATGAAPWFTLPHTANDNLVRAMAELVRDGLPAGQTVFVEHSNEVWNSIFSQNDAALASARAAWPDADVDDFSLKMNWHGQRTAEICDIWKGVFADEAHRVRCVLGAQGAATYSATQALDCPLWGQAPCSGHGIDTVAIAPYFGAHLASSDVAAEVLAWTQQSDGGLGSLFTELSEGGVLSNSRGGVVNEVNTALGGYRTLTDSRHLSLVAYEGGQHMADVFARLDDAVVELFSAANADPRMGDIYDAYLGAWRDIVGELFVHYTDIEQPGRYGAWGALAHVGQTSSPKYDALLRYLDGTRAD